MAGPLDKIRILDLTAMLLGPFATQILGDMGADVIKVEAPDGDAVRTIGLARHPGMGALFLNINRNKRSLVLDLKQKAARDVLLRLAASADVFVHSMRPQAIARLGLGYDEIAAVNPEIIYCGAYGFGRAGPYHHKAALDDIIQAASGLADVQGGRDGAPAYVNSPIVDKTASLFTVYAIAMALFHRERTGAGQAIEVPMFETMVAFNMVEHLYGLSFEPPLGTAGYPRALSPDRRPYATSDGYLGVLPYLDKHWTAIFELAGRADLAADPRFASVAARNENIDALYAELAAIIATRSTAEWLADLDAASIPAMPVIAVQDLPQDPHLKAAGFWRLMEHPSEGTLRTTQVPITMSKSPGSIRRLAPLLGARSQEIPKDAGLREADIEARTASGATLQARNHRQDKD